MYSCVHVLKYRYGAQPISFAHKNAINTKESETAPGRRQDNGNSNIQHLYYQKEVRSLSTEVLPALTGQNGACVSSKEVGPFTNTSVPTATFPVSTNVLHVCVYAHTRGQRTRTMVSVLAACTVAVMTDL